jgi:hypothetical protein
MKTNTGTAKTWAVKKSTADAHGVLSLSLERLKARRADCLFTASNQALEALTLRHTEPHDNGEAARFAADIARLEMGAMKDKGEARGIAHALAEIEYVLSLRA